MTREEAINIIETSTYLWLRTTDLERTALSMALEALADRKTEPQYSEDDMYWLSLAEDVANGKMSDAGANQAWLEYINHKTEPTSSKMEQVDWKDEMWTEAVEDEPQTDCAWM